MSRVIKRSFTEYTLMTLLCGVPEYDIIKMMARRTLAFIFSELFPLDGFRCSVVSTP